MIISSGLVRLFAISGPPFPKHRHGPVKIGRLIEASLSAETITATALREEGICRDAVNLMMGILGAVMGDHVLTMGCWRGAVITGGIIPYLQPLIFSSPLERRFRSVGEMSHILGNVPVFLSTDPYAGLKGAKAAFVNPHLAHRMITT